MYTKRGARAELLFRQSKPIDCLTFSLKSPSSLLKLPILDHAWKTTVPNCEDKGSDKLSTVSCIKIKDLTQSLRQLNA